MNNERPDDLNLFAAVEAAIKWRRLGEGTFLFVESFDFAFCVQCVTKDGKLANPHPTPFGNEVLPAGEFYQARGHKDGAFVLSPLYNSMDKGKEACEHFRLHGTFPATL